jgi:hypothetical protein
MNWMTGLAVLVLVVAIAAPMVLWRRRRVAARRDPAEVWLTGDPDPAPTSRDDPSDGDGGSDGGGD